MASFLAPLVGIVLACVSVTKACAQEESVNWGSTVGGEIIMSILAGRPGVKYEGHWKPSRTLERPGVHTLDEWVLKGESAETWTQRFQVQNFMRRDTSPPSPAAMMADFKGALDKGCPGIDWRPVRSTEWESFSEAVIPECGAGQPRHDLVRILFGRFNIWLFSYARKGPPMAEPDRTKWLNVLSEPRVEVKAQGARDWSPLH